MAKLLNPTEVHPQIQCDLTDLSNKPLFAELQSTLLRPCSVTDIPYTLVSNPDPHDRTTALTREIEYAFDLLFKENKLSERINELYGFYVSQYNLYDTQCTNAVCWMMSTTLDDYSTYKQDLDCIKSYYIEQQIQLKYRVLASLNLLRMSIGELKQNTSCHPSVDEQKAIIQNSSYPILEQVSEVQSNFINSTLQQESNVQLNTRTMCKDVTDDYQQPNTKSLHIKQEPNVQDSRYLILKQVLDVQLNPNCSTIKIEPGTLLDASSTNTDNQPNTILIQKHDPDIQVHTPQRLNPKALSIMKEWYEANIEHPYPSADTRSIIAAKGGITEKQCKTWFMNKRSNKRLQPIRRKSTINNLENDIKKNWKILRPELLKDFLKYESDNKVRLE